MLPDFLFISVIRITKLNSYLTLIKNDFLQVDTERKINLFMEDLY